MNVSTAKPTGTPAKFAAIRALERAGYVLVPLNGKVPTVRDWQETKPGAYDESNLTGNYGVVLGAEDLVVDIDPRNFAPDDNPVARLAAAIGTRFTSFAVRTGGGGYHVYFKKSSGILVRNSLKGYPGIEFKSAGRQVVGPGSVHPDTGKEYVITAGSPGEIAEAPAALLELIQRTAAPLDEVGTGTYVNDPATQGRYLYYLEHVAEPSTQGEGGDANAYRVACHGRDMGLPPAVTQELMLEIWNPRCSPPWSINDLHAKVVHAYKYARGTVGAGHPAADFDKVAPDPLAEKEPEVIWETTSQGRIVRCFQNLLSYLRDPSGGLYQVFAYNEFTGRVEFVRPAPWHRGRLPRVPVVGDHDLALLKGFLATRCKYDASIPDIETAIRNVAHHSRFHPVREYLSGLKWDGQARLDTWLRDHLGALDNAYTRACARKVLCAAVVRVFHPGTKFDHVLVLEGAQDLGKSSAIEILAGDWASDAPIDPHSRDTIDAMQGRWIIELAELDVLSSRKVDEDALKAFITRRTDRARLAYGRTTGEFPRQSIFIATKNPGADGTYLKDDTGNRRWWPVRCEPRHGPVKAQIDFAGLKAARDQLFAEAVQIAQKEKLYMETADLKAAAYEEAAQRHAEHEWVEKIASWLHELDSKPETRREFMTGCDVFVDCLGGAPRTFDRRSALSIAKVMRSLGWVVGHRRVGGRFSRGYVCAQGPEAHLAATL